MNYSFTLSVQKKIRKLAKRRPEFVNQFDIRLSILQRNPRHASLRLHKLEGFERQTWSISITESLRALFIYVDDGILIVDVGTHDEVY
ncbi:MAG: plasmid stabilization protein [Patescibacteria group bacterium]